MCCGCCACASLWFCYCEKVNQLSGNIQVCIVSTDPMTTMTLQIVAPFVRVVRLTTSKKGQPIFRSVIPYTQPISPAEGRSLNGNGVPMQLVATLEGKPKAILKLILRTKPRPIASRNAPNQPIILQNRLKVIDTHISLIYSDFATVYQRIPRLRLGGHLRSKLTLIPGRS